MFISYFFPIWKLLDTEHECPQGSHSKSWKSIWWIPNNKYNTSQSFFKKNCIISAQLKITLRPQNSKNMWQTFFGCFISKLILNSFQIQINDLINHFCHITKINHILCSKYLFNGIINSKFNLARVTTNEQLLDRRSIEKINKI